MSQCAIAGWAIPQERIARVIGFDPKTLRKHFGDELSVGSAKLEAQLAQNLLRIAQGHDRQALIATIFALKTRFGWIEACHLLASRRWARRRQQRYGRPRSWTATPRGAAC